MRTITNTNAEKWERIAEQDEGLEDIGLSENQALVVKGRMNDFAPKDMATHMGVSTSSIRQSLLRARRKYHAAESLIEGIDYDLIAKRDTQGEILSSD